MRVIPVIDLLRGVVVRGVAGRRSEYKPVESELVSSPAPAKVAAAFVRELDLRLGYLADLDAIGGAEPNFAVYAEVLGAGLNLWVDAGVRDAARAKKLAQFSAGGQRLAGVVLGLETIESPVALAQVASAVPPAQRVFSLDLKQGLPLAGPEWGGRTALEITASAVASGCQRLIVLDLAQVGVGGGTGTENLCRTLGARFPEVEIIAGGGVRQVDDLRSLAAVGCRAALVASALHNRAIGHAEMHDLRALAER